MHACLSEWFSLENQSHDLPWASQELTTKSNHGSWSCQLCCNFKPCWIYAWKITSSAHVNIAKTVWTICVFPWRVQFKSKDYTIYNAGAFPCNRATEGMGSGTSVSLNFAAREVVILGTQYAGEMKKGLVHMAAGWCLEGVEGRWYSILVHVCMLQVGMADSWKEISRSISIKDSTGLDYINCKYSLEWQGALGSISMAWWDMNIPRHSKTVDPWCRRVHNHELPPPKERYPQHAR